MEPIVIILITSIIGTFITGLIITIKTIFDRKKDKELQEQAKKTFKEPPKNNPYNFNHNNEFTQKKHHKSYRFDSYYEFDKKQTSTQNHYEAKQSLMTNCEQAYFEAIKTATPPFYTVQPQVNLATVINKTNFHYHQNELFRNIDFGIFDQNYKIVALIEINDKSHKEPKRIERDKKVKQICKEANIPLITFWTEYGIQLDYIRKRINEALTKQILN